MSRRPDPREFGRKVAPLTADQRSARRWAVTCFVLFAVCLAGSFGIEAEGAAVVLVVAAFMALCVGVVSASEA